MGLLDDKWFKPVEIPKKQHSRKIESVTNKTLKKKKVRRGRKKRGIPLMRYKDYMGSSYWKRRKDKYWSKYGKKCAVCGKKKGTTLHHKIYNHKLYGREPDHHLVALCARHHGEFHREFKTKANMEKETKEYIQTAKQLHEANIDDLSWIV